MMFPPVALGEATGVPPYGAMGAIPYGSLLQVRSSLETYLDIKHLNIEMQTSGVHVWLLLWKAERTLESQATLSLQGIGMCPSDFGVLEALLHKGPLPVNAIGKKVLLTSGSMTAAVDRLENRGLVERRDDPADRRTRVIHLTDEGRKLIRKLFAMHEKDMERAVSALNAREREELSGLLRKLGRSAEGIEI
jgi:MarR family 2-MHQ and catechol resistance regulon transcriptional repressor